MRMGWARWSGSLLAGGVGLTIGFAGGCVATMAVSWLITRSPLAAYLRLVATLMGVSILVGVLVAVGVCLSFGSELRRLAGRIDRITPPEKQAAPPPTSSPSAQEAWRGQAVAPGQGTTVGLPTVPPGRIRSDPAVTIGGPEPLEPLGSNVGISSERWSGAAGEKRERNPSAAAFGLAPADGWNSSANGIQADLPVSGFTPVSERLVEVWAHYFERGDGHFEPLGLQRQLEVAGLDGKVVAEEGLGDCVLGVDLGDGQVYLLPHFNSTPRAVAGWFDARPGVASRLARIQRLVQVAVTRRSRNGRLELHTKGIVE